MRLTVLLLMTISPGAFAQPAGGPQSPAGNGPPRNFSSSVRSYGATGDGTTDDAPALQAALNAAAGGGTVTLPCGTYVIAAEVLYGSNLLIQGAGRCSVLKNSSTRTAPFRMLAPVAPGVTTVTLKDLVIDQNFTALGWDANSYAVSADQTSDFKATGVVFRDIITMAVWAQPTTTPTVRLTLTGNTIESSEAGGFSVFGVVRDSLISANAITACKDDAIAVQAVNVGGAWYQPDGFTITGNTITDCNRRNAPGSTPNGIVAFGAKNGAISLNVISNVVSNCINVIAADATAARSSHIAIRGNTCSGAGSTIDSTSGVPVNGYQIYESDDITISNGTLTLTKGSGIRVYHAKRVSISSVSISATGSGDIEID